MPVSPQLKAWRDKRYAERNQAIVAHLGGKCVRCGATEFLQVDHRDPAMKSFEVREASWWMAWDRLLVEVNKCQLLCGTCHSSKTILDNGHKPAVGTHGTLSSCRYCNCDLCREAKNRYSRDYRRRTRKTAFKRPRTGLVHGTKNGYNYYKCRCDACREAVRVLASERRKRAVKPTIPSGEGPAL